MLSVSNWRASRARLAPRAARIAISRCLAVARTSRRLATLAHAINSTELAAANNTQSVRPTSPTMVSASGSKRYSMIAVCVRILLFKTKAMASVSLWLFDSQARFEPGNAV